MLSVHISFQLCTRVVHISYEECFLCHTCGWYKHIYSIAVVIVVYIVHVLAG